MAWSTSDPVRDFLLRLLQEEVPTVARPYLAFVDLGIPVTPADFGFLFDSSQVDRAFQFALLINALPPWDADHRWIKTDNLLWDVYERWISTYVPPPLTLDKHEKKLLAEARRYLERNFDRYWEYRELWVRADTTAAYWRAMPEDERPPDYELRLREAEEAREHALQEWEIRGVRSEYERHYAIVADLSRRDPSLAKEELRSQLGPPVWSDFGDFYWTGLAPASALEAGAPWPSFEIRSEELRGASPRRGAWLFSDHTLTLSTRERDGTELRSTHETIPADGTTIRFEMARLSIQRAWFSSTLLESRAWKWSTSTPSDPLGGFPLSTGGPAPSGHLAVLPVELVLLRNREIRGPWVRDWISRRAGIAEARLGPLLLHRDGASEPADPESDRLFSEEMEVVALLCSRVPMAPNPDWALWPSANGVDDAFRRLPQGDSE